ncbi:MAG TPA: hypothetical protein VNK04_13730 [Gemmataceae bacterium]|nr:hypothetical protein [Gemmataceae bacterium]
MAAKVKSRPVSHKTKSQQAKSKPAATKTKAKAAAAIIEPEPLPETWHVPPMTKEECLERIQLLGVRVGNYIRFMNGIDNVKGTSEEARQRALTAFYDRLLLLERELGRIQEDLQLG